MSYISNFFRNIFTRINLWIYDHPYGNETFWILFRLSFFVFSLSFYAFVGGWLFEPVNPDLLINNPLNFFNQNSLRYIIVPLAAIISVIITGIYFLKDVYNIKNFKPAMNYVLASMFTADYPLLTVDKGKKEISKGEINLLEIIGGPGFVNIQPGNAVFSRFLRMPTGAKISRSVFLSPFETVGPPVNLDDQNGHVDEFEAMTKDGIQVILKDINFRFRVIYKKGAQRTADDPYPFDEEALARRGINLTINDQGLVPWDMSVRMAVTTAISQFINTHMIDYLTAPRQDGKHPREDFRTAILKNTRVWAVGADLLWIDVGHLHIVSEDVDQARLDLWATEWKGSVDTTRAYGEAKRQAYLELGRAEAQVELIISIIDALKDAEIGNDPRGNVRTLLLARTAQILEAMEAPPPKEEKKDK
jgi:hypothetical protein